MAVHAAKVVAGRLSKSGQDIIAYSMYRRGERFIGAALLLRKQVGFSDYVGLHLTCTGLEVTLKGILLFKNFNQHWPKLRQYGHNLDKLSRMTIEEFNQNRMRPEIGSELMALNKFYSEHLTRYAGLHDIFISPKSIAHERILRRILALVRLAKRQIAKTQRATIAVEFEY